MEQTEEVFGFPLILKETDLEIRVDIQCME